MGKFQDQFSKKISATDTGYKRNLYQTYLTAIEWRNVEMSGEYAQFLSTGQPFYRYPYFAQLYVFWKIFFQSYFAAQKKEGFLSLVLSEYMLMNVFIAITTTIEFIGKGLSSLFLWPFFPVANNTEFQSHLAAQNKDYADFIHHTPFYNYNYFSKLGELIARFRECPEKSFVDRISLIAVGLDYLVHGMLSAPVGYWYNQEENRAPETIDIIVKESSDVEEDTRELAAHLRQTVTAIEGVSIVQDNEQEQLFVRTNSEKHRTYAYARLRVPRYEPFQATVEELTRAGIKVREVAGQQQMQIKLRVQSETPEQLQANREKLASLEGCRELFSYQNGVDEGLTFFSLDVPTKRLKETVEEIQQDEGISIQLMHDF
ncbi:hypothetical protein BN59_01278 [Legionella massiliensis]|uniref:Uncharacterized protein n=1 Tax=Legionella massiliensis TaxID=1034943 RepID=A0A078KZ02_9GAMM|nr:hypothetical protein [Legionella massiliensis]CDZ76999.1 hypothetical protein BN59_01278 [Legionella massiliensis]CEE12737.1 hypothetical protein BN1094_01278 [Legionella massiliensis]